MTLLQILVRSFNLVLSVAYLLEISSFFTPPDSDYVPESIHKRPMPAPTRPEHRRGQTGSGHTDMAVVVDPDAVVATRRSVYLQVDTPDIFLVENIEDVNTDALMLNTALQIKYWQVTSRTALQNLSATGSNF